MSDNTVYQKSEQCFNWENYLTQYRGKPLKEISMKRKTRIILSIVAWVVCYFALHIILSPVPGDMEAVGLISVASLSAATATYFLTGGKKTC